MAARSRLRPDTAATVSIFIRPNRSLSRSGLLTLFGGFAVVTAAIVTGFAAMGAWPVFPLAGLELAVVGGVFYWFDRHAGDCEEVVTDPERVRVIRRDGWAWTRHEFQRYWARAQLCPGAAARYPSRLSIGSHGRFVEIATGVDEVGRQVLVWQLWAAWRP